MLPYWTAPLAAAIGNLLVGFGVLWTERPRALHRVFALLTTCLVLWNLDVFCLAYFDNEVDALWWSRFFRPGAFIAPAALYHFVATFRERRNPLITSLVGLGYVAGLFFVVADAQGLMIAGARRLQSGFWPIMKPLYSAFIGVMLLTFIAFLVVLVHEYRTTTSPRRRVQAKFWLLGAVVALPLASANLLPFFGIDVYPVGSLGNLVCSGIFAYAIVRHRLVDTDVVITKAVALLAGAVLVLGPLTLLAVWFDLISYGTVDDNRVFLSLLMLFLAGLAFPRITGLTEDRLGRTFFREKVEHRKAITAFSRQAARVGEPDELFEQLHEVLTTGMAVEHATVMLMEGYGHGTAHGFPHACEESLPVDSVLADALRTCGDVLVREELVAARGLSAQAGRALRELGAEVAVPLRARGQLFGVVLVGPKTSRDAFSREDLQLLSTLGNSTAIALDNTWLSDELKASQRMVARASRLSAVGTLAAGVAHEIRNPLVAVQTFLQLLPERRDDDEFIDSFRKLSLGEIGRIGRLIEELLSLAHSPVHAPEPCDLRVLVADVVTLLAPQARRSKVSLEMQNADAAEPVKASVDEGRIKQVLMNLILNAVQASGADSVVSLVVRDVERPGGERVCRIEVRDQGSGIPQDRLEDVFTPFFTTKDSGSGLGLAVAHQIVTEHGGDINFTSEVGVGTVFVIHLPASDADDSHLGQDRTPQGAVGT